MRDHRNDEAHHSQRQEVLSDVIASEYLVPQNDYNDQRQHEAYQKIMLKYFLRVQQIAAVQSIRAQTHHHPVRIFNKFSVNSNLLKHFFFLQRKHHCYRDYSVEVAAPSNDKLRHIQLNFHQPNGLIQKRFIYTVLEHKRLNM